MAISIPDWISKTEQKVEIEFRQAVHTILVAISNSSKLNQQMSMKGGILLSLVYNGIRHTRDIDFSTPALVSDFDEENFINEFEQNLAFAVNKLPYNLDCRIQSHEMRPPKSPDHTFPTFKLRIGYAAKTDSAKHRRLMNKHCPTVIEIDYSFNEPNLEHTDELHLENGGHILVYNLVDLIAEKYRALLQQTDRNRVRRQDAYDIYCLLIEIGSIEDDQKKAILESLTLKSRARDMSLTSESINDPNIKTRSRSEYSQIEDEIEGELPEFDLVFEYVKNFYLNLPW